MAEQDGTAMVDTRPFLLENGLEDQAQLALAEGIIGVRCSRSTLERLMAHIKRGCFRDSLQLNSYVHHSIAGHLGASRLAGYLAALRQFNELPTQEEVGYYLQGELTDDHVVELVGRLGRSIPEWFFPAVVQIANSIREFAAGGQQRFVAVVGPYLQYWGYGSNGRTAQSDDRLAVLLSEGFFRLRKCQPEGDWLLYLPDDRTRP